MKKKIIFCHYNMDIGGIETSLLTLLKYMDYSKYEVSLLLEKKEGIFLIEIPHEVNIIDYNLLETGNFLFRKILNRLKLICFILKNKNKYDFSVCYGTTRKVAAILGYTLSKNNAIWIHGNTWMDKNPFAIKKHFDYIKLKKYKNIIFVSHSLMESFKKTNSKTTGKLHCFNNIIDYKKIMIKSNERTIKKTKTTLVNVGRHEEKYKNLLMMIKVVNRLLNEGYSFELWMVGEGPDTDLYKNKVIELNQANNIKFFKKTRNPFVYYKSADATLLSSVSEGNPVVFVEARVLGVPIITTDVSDAKKEIDEKYGIVTECNEEDYYLGIKKFLDNGFVPKEFDAKKFNDEIIKKLEDVLNV